MGAGVAKRKYVHMSRNWNGSGSCPMSYSQRQLEVPLSPNSSIWQIEDTRCGMSYFLTIQGTGTALLCALHEIFISAEYSCALLVVGDDPVMAESSVVTTLHSKPRVPVEPP